MNKDTKIIWKPIDELIPYEHNAKEHTEKQLANLEESFRRYGWQQPCLITNDNVIITGHGRALGAKRAGLTDAPCIYCDDLSEKEIKEYRHLDNLLSDGDYIQSELEFELPELDFSGFDLDFDVNFGEEEKEIIEDEAPEVNEETEPICKLGDIWQLGNHHKLICGDSTDPAVIDRLMDGVKADMVFTDPPYGYNYQSNMRTQSEKFDVLENDDKILDFFQSIKNTVIGFVYVCATWKTVDKWIELFKNYYDLTNVIIWDKGGGGIGDLFHTFATDYEMILVCNNGQELRGKRYGSVWNFTDTEISKMKKEELLKIVLEQKEYYSIWKQKKDNPNEYMHPTQKPVALSARAIRSSTDFDANVLDVFGGSGSTLIACEQLSRKCYMAELSPEYCDVIIQRWENFTGQKAVKING